MAAESNAAIELEMSLSMIGASPIYHMNLTCNCIILMADLSYGKLKRTPPPVEWRYSNSIPGVPLEDYFKLNCKVITAKL
jgi:hypothetical protein